VVADELFAGNVEVTQQYGRAPGVFAGYGFNGFEGLDCPYGDIVQVAEWGGNHIKGSLWGSVGVSFRGVVLLLFSVQGSV